MTSNVTADITYRKLLNSLLFSPTWLPGRNGRTNRLTAYQVLFFRTPLIVARRTAWKNALREWEWFMSGSNYIGDLHESVRKWWEPWTNYLGNVQYNYSRQFRFFASKTGYIDQIKTLIKGIKEHPYSRRNVITTWNTAEMNSPHCPITNCHGTVIQAFVDNFNRLTLVTYQRSVDVICGLPHNWIQYWAFLVWLAHRTGKKPYKLTWIGGDVHLYEKHMDMAKRIIEEDPHKQPELIYKPTSDEFLADDFTLDGEYHPIINESVEMIV
jgi:thymidylate synthase